MQKLSFVLLVVFFLIGCTAFEMRGKDGNIYRYESCPECWTEAWEDVAIDLREAKDECLQGKRMDCWGDPAGGGTGGGGANGGGGE